MTPRPETAPSTNPTGIPMRMGEGSLWVPGDAVGNNINHNFNKNTVNPKIIVGAGSEAVEAAGGRRSIPVSAPAETPPGTAEVPASTPEDPRLRAEIDELKKQMEAMQKKMEEQEERHKKELEEKDKKIAELEEELKKYKRGALDKEERDKLTAEHKDELSKLEGILQPARDRLIALQVRREARMTDKYPIRGANAEKDAKDYEEALKEYEWMLAIMAMMSVRQYEESKGSNAERVRVAISEFLTQEDAVFLKGKHQYARDELEKIKSDAEGPLARFLAKRVDVYKWYADRKTLTKILLGAGVGAGLSLTSLGLGLGVAGLAVGTGIKVSIGLVGRKASNLNVSKHAEKKNLERIAEAGKERRTEDRLSSDDELDSYLERYLASVRDEKVGDVKHAQRMNKIGNGVLAASGVLSVLGTFDALSPGIHHTISNPLAHHHPQTPGAEHKGGLGSSYPHHAGSGGAHHSGGSTGAEGHSGSSGTGSPGAEGGATAPHTGGSTGAEGAPGAHGGTTGSEGAPGSTGTETTPGATGTGTDGSTGGPTGGESGTGGTTGSIDSGTYGNGTTAPSGPEGGIGTSSPGGASLPPGLEHHPTVTHAGGMTGSGAEGLPTGSIDNIGNLPPHTHLAELSVHNGSWHDTIWYHVQNAGGTGDINRHVQEVLNLNRDRIMEFAHPGDDVWGAARNLPEHFKFVMPDSFGAEHAAAHITGGLSGASVEGGLSGSGVEPVLTGESR